MPLRMRSATAPVFQRRELAFFEPEFLEADDFALVHRDAAENLREIFAKADAGQQLFGLAEPAFAAQALGVGSELLDRLDVSREPGEAVGGVLLGFELARTQLAVDADALAQGGGGAGERGFGGMLRGAAEVLKLQNRLPFAFCCVATWGAALPLAIGHLTSVVSAL